MKEYKKRTVSALSTTEFDSLCESAIKKMGEVGFELLKENFFVSHDNSPTVSVLHSSMTFVKDVEK